MEIQSAVFTNKEENSITLSNNDVINLGIVGNFKGALILNVGNLKNQVRALTEHQDVIDFDQGW